MSRAPRGGQPTVAPPSAGTRRVVLAGVMLALSLAALDSTIVAAAVPSIVADVGGFAHFPWLFSAYLLTQAVTVPVYGRLADAIGRRPVILVGIGIFLLGSLLCGLAWNMTSLIVFRAVQGLGGGAVQPISMTIVSDLYSVRERARIQGALGANWGVASLSGPLLGGVLAQYASWRWIFLINLPAGLLAMLILARRLRDPGARGRGGVDVASALTLVAGGGALILALLSGGVVWPWRSMPTLVLVVVAALALTAFVRRQRGRPTAVLPGWLFSRRVILASLAISAGVGAVVIGLSSYVPTFVTAILGGTPVVAGVVVVALALGWPLVTTFSGRLYTRIGFRNTSLIGAALLVPGTALLTLPAVTASVVTLCAACLLTGFGIGLVTTPSVVAVQYAVPWSRRGAATAAVMFFRSIGSTVGAAALGAVANAVLVGRLRHGSAADPTLPSTPDSAEQLLRTAPHDRTGDLVRSALSGAVHTTFVVVAAIAVVVAVAAFALPRTVEPLTFEEPDDATGVGRAVL